MNRADNISPFAAMFSKVVCCRGVKMRLNEEKDYKFFDKCRVRAASYHWLGKCLGQGTFPSLVLVCLIMNT